MRRINFTAVIIALVIVLAAGQLGLSHFLASEGEKIRQVEREISRLEMENRQLTEGANRAASLAIIAVEAEKLGLIKNAQGIIAASQLRIAKER